MAVSHNDFVALFDEFKLVNGKKIELFLNIAKNRVSAQVWGAMYETGLYYLAAHMLVSSGTVAGVSGSNSGAAGGALTQVSVGDISKSFAEMADNDSGDSTLKLTAYGRMFLELRRETVVSFGVTGAPLPGSGIC